MTSPFPGMDPYIEQFWSEVHGGLVTYARDQLQSRLPDDLTARMEIRVFLETSDDSGRSMIPDVHIAEKYRRPRPYSPENSADSVIVAEPLIVRTNRVPVRQRFIEIRDRSSRNRVVTAIEFVSPSNKTNTNGRKMFLRKRRECLNGGANWVEIDLTRAAHRDLILPENLISHAEHADYFAYVNRASERAQFEVYCLPLRARLPAIRIPLRKTDPDTFLDLQALVDQCYRNGRYAVNETYSNGIDPALNSGDEKWANDLLKAAGFRTSPAKRKEAV